jgi:hypothetical protein
MAATSFIQCRVTAEFKLRVRELSARRNLSESELVKHLLSVALDGNGVPTLTCTAPAGPRGRLHVRIYPDDRLLLVARAAARGMAPASYVTVLLRAHLRALAPLPKEELKVLKRCVADLGLVGRNLDRIVQADSGGTAQVREDLRAMLKLSQGMRDHVKGLLKANIESWRVGYAT